MAKAKTLPKRCTLLLCGRDLANVGKAIKDKPGNLFCSSSCMVKWWGESLPEETDGWSSQVKLGSNTD